MNMSNWPAVHGLVNGQKLDGATLNSPIRELAVRTESLKQSIDDIYGAGPNSCVKYTGCELSVSGDLAPVPGDVVYLNPATHVYEKARASMSLVDDFVMSEKAFAIGILTSSTQSYGTVLAFGKADLAEIGITPQNMVEPGEEFRDGVYYLSSEYPGKITAYPSGPMIIIGTFSGQTDTAPAFGLLYPQHRDTGESHVHRTYRLTARPAGEPLTTSETPDGTHHVVGYRPDGVKDGALDVSEVTGPRLRISGDWHTRHDVTYTIWLSTEYGVTVSSAPVPSSDFSDLFLHWKSSDADEGQGKSRVSTFFQPVPVGSHGMTVYLEPCSEGYEGSPAPYDITSGELYEGDAFSEISARKWTVEMPYAGKGWLSSMEPHVMSPDSERDNVDVIAIGKPSRRIDRLTVFASDACYRLDNPSSADPDANPPSGTTVTVNGEVYEFIDANGEHTPGTIEIPIAGTREDTMYNFASASGVRVTSSGNYCIALNEDQLYIFSDSVESDWFSPVIESGTSGESASGSTAAKLTAVDSAGYIVTLGDKMFTPSPAVPVKLSNGQYVVFGVRSGSSVQIPSGSFYTVSSVNPAPGYKFSYAIGMDEDLNHYFPPVPYKSASLTLNGVELDSGDYFSDTADGGFTYVIDTDSIYWMPDSYQHAPWPAEYTGPDVPIEPYLQNRLILHFVRGFLGDTGPVTSIRPAPDSGIRIVDCGTREPATVGDLMISAELVADVYDNDLSGFKAVKRGRGGKLELGPVVERIRAGSGVRISSELGNPEGQGTVTISTDSGYSGEFENIALENAKQELIGMFPYVKLLGWTTNGNNINSGFVAQFKVPLSVSEGLYRVNVYATVFGTKSASASSIMYAGIKFNYNVLPDWKPVEGSGIEKSSLNLSSDLIQPDNEISAMIPVTFMDSEGQVFPEYKAFDPVLIHNDSSIIDTAGRSYRILGNALPNNSDCSAYCTSHSIQGNLGLRPGYIVAVRFSRGPVTQGVTEYTNPIGFINLRWELKKV